MNIFYRHEEAREVLKRNLSQVKVEEVEDGDVVYMGDIVKDTGNMKVLRHTENNLRSPRLVVEKENGGFKEVCVRLPGILCRKVLPPIRRDISNSQPHAVRALKQSVKLTALGLEDYEDIQHVMDVVHQLFEQELGPGTVQPVLSKPYEGHLAFDIGTRYFTDRDDAPCQEHVPFSRDEDPLFILELMRKGRFIRSEDNIVQYCAKVAMEGSRPSYSPFKPENFEEGDIVEAHISFACWPISKDSYQLTLIMRALASVDTRLRTEATVKAKKVKQQSSRGGGSRKRVIKNDENFVVKRHRIVYDMDE
ncbi:hypothetical protein CVT24_002701 [Panaeolus cyanescens]|uniref:Uncharacterized protein n=1 Tax=Panaeolus cyanescens TaxID=181874 RepID=A0A409YYC6_9AGAR|nr:hypothetical protein CVT24_002701 [Panaeolus cyanescens]